MYLRILLLLLLITVSGCSQTLPIQTYLIPKRTEGYVYIFHNVPTGEKDRTINDETIFTIPASRILVTQNQAVPYASVVAYFLVTNDGKRIRLDIVAGSINRTPENLADNRPVVFGLATATSSGPDFPCEVRYETFYVGTPALLLARTNEDREREYTDFRAFVTVNADRLCARRSATPVKR